MDRRAKNVMIFKDSMDLIQDNSKLQQAIRESVKKQKLYLVLIPDDTHCFDYHLDLMADAIGTWLKKQYIDNQY